MKELQAMNTEVSQPLLFNYSNIDVDTTNYLKQTAQETRGLLKRTTDDIIKIGQNLIDAKARLPHGQFLPWITAELGISQSTAWRFMQVAKGKPIKSFKMNDFTPQIEAPEEDKKRWDDLTPDEQVEAFKYWRAVFDLLREDNPRFDAMLKMFHDRYEFLVHCKLDPEEDDCLSLMKDEIDRFLDTPVGEILKENRTA